MERAAQLSVRVVAKILPHVLLWRHVQGSRA